MSFIFILQFLQSTYSDKNDEQTRATRERELKMTDATFMMRYYIMVGWMDTKYIIHLQFSFKKYKQFLFVRHFALLLLLLSLFLL